MGRNTHDLNLDHHGTFGVNAVFTDQGSDPGASAAGTHVVYTKSGGLFIEDSSGVVIGPMESRKGGGVATVASATTSIVVTHGAGYTPAAQDILICPTNNPTNDPGWFWVDTITATQFTINVRSDPGASGASFAWRVDR